MSKVFFILTFLLIGTIFSAKAEEIDPKTLDLKIFSFSVASPYGDYAFTNQKLDFELRYKASKEFLAPGQTFTLSSIIKSTKCQIDGGQIYNGCSLSFKFANPGNHLVNYNLTLIDKSVVTLPIEIKIKSPYKKQIICDDFDFNPNQITLDQKRYIPCRFFMTDFDSFLDKASVQIGSYDALNSSNGNAFEFAQFIKKPIRPRTQVLVIPFRLKPVIKGNEDWQVDKETRFAGPLYVRFRSKKNFYEPISIDTPAEPQIIDIIEAFEYNVPAQQVAEPK